MANEFGVVDNLGEGGAGIVPGYPMPDGENLITYLRSALGQSVKPVASVAAIKAITAANRQAGTIVLNTADQSLWRFHATSALTGDDLLVITPTAGDGRWLRLPGPAVLSVAITYATANNAVLWTVPTGARIRPVDFYWGVTSSFTGGTVSAIGVSSNKANYTTAGDLLGGATGDVLATLAAAATPIFGTIGAGFDTVAKRRAIWLPTDNLKFNRITSAFTAGVGTVNVVCDVLANAGA
jgi:hypothetical protein